MSEFEKLAIHYLHTMVELQKQVLQRLATLEDAIRQEREARRQELRDKYGFEEPSPPRQFADDVGASAVSRNTSGRARLDSRYPDADETRRD